jgi:hypothetical protein
MLVMHSAYFKFLNTQEIIISVIFVVIILKLVLWKLLQI